MTNEKRAATAFICGNMNRAIAGTRLYDYSQGKLLPYSVDKQNDTINVYDFNRSSYLNGNNSMIYDYASQSYIQIIYNENTFSGYDFESESSFSGSYNNDVITIYDYQYGKHFNYCIY